MSLPHCTMFAIIGFDSYIDIMVIILFLMLRNLKIYSKQKLKNQSITFCWKSPARKEQHIFCEAAKPKT